MKTVNRPDEAVRRFDAVPLLPLFERHRIGEKRVGRIIDALEHSGYPVTFYSGSALLLKGAVIRRVAGGIVSLPFIHDDKYYVIGVDPLEEE